MDDAKKIEVLQLSLVEALTIIRYYMEREMLQTGTIDPGVKTATDAIKYALALTSLDRELPEQGPKLLH